MTLYLSDKLMSLCFLLCTVLVKGLVASLDPPMLAEPVNEIVRHAGAIMVLNKGSTAL